MQGSISRPDEGVLHPDTNRCMENDPMHRHNGHQTLRPAKSGVRHLERPLSDWTALSYSNQACNVADHSKSNDQYFVLALVFDVVHDSGGRLFLLCITPLVRSLPLDQDTVIIHQFFSREQQANEREVGCDDDRSSNHFVDKVGAKDCRCGNNISDSARH